MSDRRVVPMLVACLFTAACDGDGGAMRAGGELAHVGLPVTSNVCASGATLFGIDVSKWQGTIDWHAVKGAGVVYAFIRVSDGVNTPDERFAANWAGAKAEGVLRGAYQFFRPGQSAMAQADLLLEAIATHGASDLPPVLDVEAVDGQSAATITSKITQWMERVEGALGVRPIIYTGPYFWEANVNSAAFADHPLWVAHWGTSCPSIPHQWSDWTFHQNSETGSVAGIGGAVDLDRFDGTLAQLLALGGGTVAAGPAVSIGVTTTPPAGQARDFRPEGSSRDVADLYEDQTFTTDVVVKNASDAAVATAVDVGVWFESPWLVPVSYTIYSDFPAKDGASWVVNDADGNPANPAHDGPPASARYQLYAMSPGESKRVRFTVRAAGYSIGQLDHPDVRAWVWHVADWYGEQTAWDDPVEVNGAGGLLRAYVQHDVYARDRWTFEAVDAAETEGWTVGNAVLPLSVDPSAHALVIVPTGADPYVHSGPAHIDAAAKKALRVRARTGGGARLSRTYFITSADASWDEDKAKDFVTPGDGAFHDVTIDLSDVPGWTGTITGLRLDPAPSGSAGVVADRYDLAELVSVASASGTSGDGDGDGVLGAPGPDCDDGDAAIAPGRPERCNGKDDDCSGTSDDGFDVGAPCSASTGECAVAGSMVCRDDGGGTRCSAVAPETCPEVCLPGASGACARPGAGAGCDVGERRCGAGGAWGACEPTPACDPTLDPDEDPPVEAGAETASGDASDVAEAHITTEHEPGAAIARTDDGCGAGPGGALGPLLIGLLLLLRRRRLSAQSAVLAAVTLGAACGDDGTLGGASDGVDSALEVLFVDTGLPADTTVIGFDVDAGSDAPVDSQTTPPDTSTPLDVSGSTIGVWGACDGHGGEGCACGDGTCAAGLECLDTDLGPLCGERCTATCDGERRCARVGDGVRACVPAWSTLCAPCDVAADCLEVGASCVDFGFDGSFCAPPCAFGTTCPAGFDCAALGQPAQSVCVPREESCGCSAVAVALGMATTCQADDGSGCSGTRTCTAGGLSACNAGSAQPELCNDRDDDCNGATDEGCDVDDDGWCAGEAAPATTSAACPGGFGDCDDEERLVHPGVLEACNDRDDDCDGTTDQQTRGCQAACGGGQETCVDGAWGACNGAAPLCDAADPCCQASGCAYEPASVRCQVAAVASEQRCNGTCGGTVEARERHRYCTGTSAGCGDGNLQWGTWSPQTTCGADLCVASGGSASCDDCPLGCSGGQCVTQATTIVCIDPAYGPAGGPASGGVNAHQVTWSIASHLAAWLSADSAAAGGGTWQVVMTRTADTTPSSDERRATCDAAGAQRVISIGVNGFNGVANGSETYRKDTADPSWVDFATKVQSEVIAKGGLFNRGVKVGTFAILMTQAPSVWTFPGFLDNAADRAKLADDAWRHELARGLLHALQSSLGYATFTP